MGVDGNAILQTPHLDALGSGPCGSYFQAAYAESPVCGPQRCAWLHGQHPLTFGGNRWDKRIWERRTTIAESLSEQGYHCGVFGKRHFSPNRDPFGFHEFKIYESGREGEEPDDYLTWLRKETEWGGYARGHGVGNNDIFAAASVLPESCYPSSWVAQESVDYLDRHAATRPDQPFFLWASFNKPHSPYDPPQPYDRMYRPQDMPGPARFASLDDELPPLQRAARHYTWHTHSEEQVKASRAYYYGLITHIDDCLGRILEKLDDLGMRDNTLIAFTSDHGDMMGDHHVYFKGIYYEGSARVPYLWWIPEKQRQRLKLSQTGGLSSPVGVSSLSPTLMELAGVKCPESFNGGSLVPLLQGQPDASKSEVVAAYQAYQRHRNSVMLRWENWKYIFWQYGGYRELFDVCEDPGELKNLAEDPRCKATAEEAHRRLEIRLKEYAWGEKEVLNASGILDSEPYAPPDDFMPAINGPWGRRAT